MNPHDIIKRPILTEKALRLRDEQRTYVFEVDLKATKVDIKQAVEKLFGVKVEKVRTLIVKPKPRRNIRSRRHVGYTRHWKKAYVKLREGERIESLEGV